MLRALRGEAEAAGDHEQVAYCDIALAPHELHDVQTAEWHLAPDGQPITRTDARQICADAINEAVAKARC